MEEAVSVRLLLLLIAVVKINRLRLFPLDLPRLSSPKPRLRYGRRHTHLFFPKSNPKSVYSFLHSIAGSSSSSSSSPHFPNCFPPRELASFYADYLRSRISVFQPKIVRSRARDYFSELRRATFLEESHSFFCSLFSSTEWLVTATNLISFNATGPDKGSFPMIKHLLSSGLDFLLVIFNLIWSLHFFSSI